MFVDCKRVDLVTYVTQNDTAIRESRFCISSSMKMNHIQHASILAAYTKPTYEIVYNIFNNVVPTITIALTGIQVLVSKITFAEESTACKVKVSEDGSNWQTLRRIDDKKYVLPTIPEDKPFAKFIQLEKIANTNMAMYNMKIYGTALILNNVTTRLIDHRCYPASAESLILYPSLYKAIEQYILFDQMEVEHAVQIYALWCQDRYRVPSVMRNKAKYLLSTIHSGYICVQAVNRLLECPFHLQDVQLIQHLIRQVKQCPEYIANKEQFLQQAFPSKLAQQMLDSNQVCELMPPIPEPLSTYHLDMIRLHNELALVPVFNACEQQQFQKLEQLMQQAFVIQHCHNPK